QIINRRVQRIVRMLPKDACTRVVDVTRCVILVGSNNVYTFLKRYLNDNTVQMLREFNRRLFSESSQKRPGLQVMPRLETRHRYDCIKALLRPVGMPTLGEVASLYERRPRLTGRLSGCFFWPTLCRKISEEYVTNIHVVPVFCPLGVS